MLDAEKEKISEEIIDAMLEQEETAATDKSSDKKSTGETSAGNVAEKSTENPPAVDMTDTTTEKMPTETEAVTEEMDLAAEVQDSDVAKLQSTTATEEAVVTATQVDEKGDADKSDAVKTDTSDKPDTAAETGAGDAQFKTGT